MFEKRYENALVVDDRIITIIGVDSPCGVPFYPSRCGPFSSFLHAPKRPASTTATTPHRTQLGGFFLLPVVSAAMHRVSNQTAGGVRTTVFRGAPPRRGPQPEGVTTPNAQSPLSLATTWLSKMGVMTTPALAREAQRARMARNFILSILLLRI